MRGGDVQIFSRTEEVSDAQAPGIAVTCATVGGSPREAECWGHVHHFVGFG